MFGYWRVLSSQRENRKLMCLCTACNITTKLVDVKLLLAGRSKSCYCRGAKRLSDPIITAWRLDAVRNADRSKMKYKSKRTCKKKYGATHPMKLKKYQENSREFNKRRWAENRENCMKNMRYIMLSNGEKARDYCIAAGMPQTFWAFKILKEKGEQRFLSYCKQYKKRKSPKLDPNRKK